MNIPDKAMIPFTPVLFLTPSLPVPNTPAVSLILRDLIHFSETWRH